MLAELRPVLDRLRGQKREFDRLETRIDVLLVATAGADAENPDAIELRQCRHEGPVLHAAAVEHEPPRRGLALERDAEERVGRPRAGRGLAREVPRVLFLVEEGGELRGTRRGIRRPHAKMARRRGVGRAVPARQLGEDGAAELEAVAPEEHEPVDAQDLDRIAEGPLEQKARALAQRPLRPALRGEVDERRRHLVHRPRRRVRALEGHIRVAKSEERPLPRLCAPDVRERRRLHHHAHGARASTRNAKRAPRMSRRTAAKTPTRIASDMASAVWHTPGARGRTRARAAGRARRGRLRAAAASEVSAGVYRRVSGAGSAATTTDASTTRVIAARRRAVRGSAWRASATSSRRSASVHARAPLRPQGVARSRSARRADSPGASAPIGPHAPPARHARRAERRGS